MNAPGGITRPPPSEEDEFTDAGFEQAYVGYLVELQELEGNERRTALADWVRTGWFSACGFLLEGWQGALHREAWRYHRADLEASTPGKTWNEASREDGRATINRLLGAEGWQHSHYATFPFRLIWTQEDEPWIGAAVGCMPLLDAEMLGAWEHIDIRAVILWNPKTKRTRMLGDEEQPSHLILPQPMPDTLDVFTDTGAFFGAWAKLRASYAAMAKLHQLPESRDGHLPGALVIGGIDKARFPIHATSTLVARPPLSRGKLRDAVIRSANLPQVKEAVGANG